MDFILGLVMGLVTSVAFWPLFAVLVCFLWGTVEHERGGWATFFTILAGLLLIARWPALGAFVVDNWILVLITYFIAGVAWSFTKWILFVSKASTWFVSTKEGFLTRKGLPTNYFATANRANVDSDVVQKFVDCLHCEYPSFLGMKRLKAIMTIDEAVGAVTPKADAHKSSLLMWAIYWPFSLAWYLLNDFVMNIFEFLYKHFGNMYQRISNQLFKDVL